MAAVRDAVDLALDAGPTSFFVKLGLSAFFLSFPIHRDDMDLFYCEAGGDYFQFLTLVFGRKDAPRVSSLMADIGSSAMEDAGILHVRYLDDFFLVGTTPARVWAATHKEAKILMDFGFVLALNKVEGPSQRLEFLGIIIDSKRGFWGSRRRGRAPSWTC